MKIFHIPGQLFLFLYLILAIHPANAQVSPTDEWVNFYSRNTIFQGAPVPVGAVIDAYDPDGVHCGSGTVSVAGEYGFLVVYRDDLLTQSIDEGAMPGDTITFKINGKLAHRLGPDAGVWTENGAILQLDLADNLPPVLENRISDVVMHEDDPDRNVADLDTIFIDADDDSLIFSSQISSSDVHASIDEENQLIIFANPEWSGEAKVIITARDQWFSVADTVLIHVLPVNDPPVIRDLPDTSFSSDTTLTLDLSNYVVDVDHPRSSLTWAAEVQPAYDDSLLVAIDNTAKTATFSTSVIFSAQVAVTITVTDDSSASDQDTMFVQVNLPVAVNYNNPHENPKNYFLSQNYPNPFNSSTLIQYQLPQPSQVVIKIMNFLGEEVATLVNRSQNSGVYTVQWQAKDLASGIYFITILAGSFSQVRKMVLVR